MWTPFFCSKTAFFSWLHRILRGNHSAHKKRRPRRRRPSCELLEDRLAPASLSDHLGTLTIILNNPGENLALAASSANHYGLTSSTNDLFNTGLTGATYTGTAASGTLAITTDTTIVIEDLTTATSVTFNNSAAISYGQAFNVMLMNPLAGDITFNGTSTFGNGLNVSTTNGNIVANAGSTINVSSGDLILAGGGDISLTGKVNVSGGGNTALNANGAITANNVANNFGAFLALFGAIPNTAAASASVKSGGALVLDQVNINGSLSASAGGAITQSLASGITVGGTSGFATTSGAVTVDNTGNSFGGAVSATVTGSDNVTLGNANGNTGGIILGAISMGSGNLQVDDFATTFGSSISQTAGGITTTGTVTINLSGFSSENIDLNGAANNIAGTVTLTGSLQSGDFRLRNTNAGAGIGQLSINTFSIVNLELDFANAAVDIGNTLTPLPSFSNDLIINAGGSITQSSNGVFVSGNAVFNSTGGDVVLDNTSNTFSADISASVTGAHSITLGNANFSTTIGNVTLVSGNLQLDDFSTFGSSTVTEDPALNGISMTPAVSSTATVNIVNDASASVDLAGAANHFAAGVQLTLNGTGGGTTGDLGFRNASNTAALNQVSLTNFTIDNFALEFDHAAIDVGSAGTPLPPFSGDLTVIAGGNITQSTNPLTVTGTASFTVLGNHNITLNNANNSITGAVSFDTLSGNGNVMFDDVAGITLGSSMLGTGTFSVTAGAGGNITESAADTITQATGAGGVSFTAGPTGTSIDLSAGTDNFFTGSITFAGASVASVALEDANPTVSLASLTLPAAPPLANVNLIFDGATSSIQLPNGVSNVPYNLAITETNDIVLPGGATFNMTGNHNLFLHSTHGNINLYGIVNVAGTGTTTLTVDGVGGSGQSILANNSANVFGTLTLTNTATTSSNTIAASGGLQLGNIDISDGGLNVTAGSISQTGGSSIAASSFTQGASFTATSGNVSLGNTTNSFAERISASVTGANTITLDNAATTTALDTITLGSAGSSLTVNDVHVGGGSTVNENDSDGISGPAGTALTVNINIVNDATANVDLSAGANNLPAGSHVNITGIGGGTSGNLGFRNVNPAAAMSQVVLTNFSIKNLTVVFETTSIDVHTLPSFSLSGNLTLATNGNITETSGALIHTTGAVSFIIGVGDEGAAADGSITLTNNNNISGTVSFANAGTDNKQAIQFKNITSIILGASQLGLGSFTLTATGTITSTGAIQQALGGGAVTLNALGNTIALNQAGNEFSGPVTFNGTGINNLTTIGFENDDPLATLPTLTNTAATLTSATYVLAQAPIQLPSITAKSLVVKAGGNITQASGSSLTVSGEAFFTAGNFGMQLTNAGNSIAEASLSANGQNAVALSTSGGLLLDDSNLGSGPLTISAGGAITETGGTIGIQQNFGVNDTVAGTVSFSAGANPILLDNSNNQFLGPVAVHTTGAGGNVTIVDTPAMSNALILGNDTVGGGFSVTAGGFSNITQAPGTSMTVTGNGFFAANNGAVTLTNPGNSIAGNIAMIAGSGSASLQVTGNAKLAVTTATGQLNVTSGGNISQLSGPSPSSTNGVLNVQGANFTTTNNGNITLANSGNNFNDSPVALLAGTGAVSLTDSDPAGLFLGAVQFGAGGLTLTAGGPVAQSLGAIVGTGPVSVTNSSLLPANAIDVMLDQPGNNLSDPNPGAFVFTNIANVTIVNQGNIEFTAGSTIGVQTIESNGDVSLTAGGQVVLPTPGTLTIGSLMVSANQIAVGSNITTTANFGGIQFIGAVTFSAPATLDVSAATLGNPLSFTGNVSSGANALTFHLPDAGIMSFAHGVWNQAANMTINGASSSFDIAADATFKIGANTLTVSGMANGSPSTDNNIDVAGIFDAEGAATIGDGGSDSIIHVNFASGATFLVNLATSGALTLNGLNAGNQIDITSVTAGQAGTQLAGIGGAAPAGTTTILSVNNGGSIVGQFGNPRDGTGDVFVGTDLVQPAYATTKVTIQPDSLVFPSTVTGNEPDGDIFKVTVTGGSGLEVMEASTGTGPGALQGLAVVVRNASAATTLTITTTANGGDGFTQLIGLGFDGAGAVTINAAQSNLIGNIFVGGALTSLSLHDWNRGILSAGGTSAGSTAITGDVFTAVKMHLGTKLNTLTVAAYVGNQSSIAAASFGTIAANGSAAQTGDFNVNLQTNPAAPPAQALLSATIKGTLSGNWDLAGNVGGVVGTTTLGVTATNTSFFNLGLRGGPDVGNAGLVNNITFLTLGTTSAFGLDAAGSVTTMTFVSLNNSLTPAKVVQANAFTTITTTGASMDHGNLIANITATGNTGATHIALGTLKVAGNLGPDSGAVTIMANNGNIGTITVGRLVQNITLDALSTAVGGAITTITDGAWNSILNAKSVGTWSSIGNLPAQLFGTFSGTVHLTGTAGSSAATLGTLSTTSDMTGSEFTIDNGSVTTVTVAGELSGTTFSLASTLVGLGTITAAEWQSDNVTARSIGTIKSLGRAAALAATGALNGNIDNSSITAFGVGTTIATISAAGELVNSPVQTNGAITTFTVGRLVMNSQISTNLNANGGGIGTLTAGAWNQSDIAATTLGTVSINGFFTPELSSAFVTGNFMHSNVVLTGAITSLTVTGSLILSGGESFNVPGGIGTLKVTASIIGSGGTTTFGMLNRSSPGASVLGTFSAGQLQGVTLYVNQAGSISTTGNVSASNLAVASFKGAATFTSTNTAPVGIATLSVGGGMESSTINVKDTITTFSIAKTVSNSRVAAAFDHTNANAAITTLSAGAWSLTDLNANSIGTFNVTGNATFFLAGNMSQTRINLIGALAGVALGTFKATGTLLLTDFQITSGNVTSFTSAFFKESFLSVGYRITDFAGIFGDAADNEQAGNWEGNFTVGSFTTTAVLSSDVLHSAGFQTSGIVAAKLGTITLSGVNPTPLNPSIVTFGVGFRTTGGAAGTLKINGVAKPVGTKLPSPGFPPGFEYNGLGG